MKYKNKYTYKKQIEIFAKRLNETKILENPVDYDDAKIIFEVFTNMYTDILTNLKVGEKVTINNFLTFIKEKRESRIGREPKNPKNEYLLEYYELLQIRQSETLKENLKKKSKPIEKPEETDLDD